MGLLREYFNVRDKDRNFDDSTLSEEEQPEWSASTRHEIALTLLRWIQNIEEYSASLQHMLLDLEDRLSDDAHDVSDCLRDK